MQHDDARLMAGDPVDAMRLAEAVAARLCHDWSSPVGALANALEIIDEPDLAVEAMSIAREAAAALANRLRLVRAAWCGPTGALALDDIARLAAGLPGGRVVVSLERLAPGPFPPALARILLNLLLLAVEALPNGGIATLAGDASDGIVLSIEGQRAGWPAGLPTLLADEAAAWAAIDEPRGLQLPLTALIVRAGRFRLAPLLGNPAAIAPLLLTAMPHPA